MCVRERELESPWVLFVLIKQQLYGTLDTLDQTPSHYWNITPPQARGLQPVDVCTCQRCVRLHTSTGVSSDAFSYTQLGVWWSMHAAMNSSMCVYPWCCQHLDSPFTICCLCLLSKCWCSYWSPSCREDIVICEGSMSLCHTATEHIQTQLNKTVHQLSQYRKEFFMLWLYVRAQLCSLSDTLSLLNTWVRFNHIVQNRPFRFLPIVKWAKLANLLRMHTPQTFCPLTQHSLIISHICYV